MQQGQLPHNSNMLSDLFYAFVWLAVVGSRDEPRKSPGSIRSPIALETTLAASQHLAQDEAPDLQLPSPVISLRLGDVVLEYDCGC